MKRISPYLPCTPQSDLDCFYNARWKKNVACMKKKLGIDKLIINNFDLVQHEINNELDNWIKNLKPDDSDQINRNIAKIRDLFPNRSENYHIMSKLTQRIANISDMESMIMVIRLLMEYDIPTLFTLNLIPNYRTEPGKPIVYILAVGEFPMTLNDPLDYEKENLIEELWFADRLGQSYSLAGKWGYDCCSRYEFMEDVIAIEVFFAKDNLTIKESKNTQITHNLVSYEDFISEFDINRFWIEILQPWGTESKVISYENRRFLEKIKSFFSPLTIEKISAIRNYFVYCIAKRHAQLLYLDYPRSVYSERIELMKAVSIIYGEHLQELFESRHANPEYKANVNRLIRQIAATFCNEVYSSEILEIESKTRIIHKLRSIKVFIGASDYSNVSTAYCMKCTTDFYTAYFKYNRHYVTDTMHLIGKRVNRSPFASNERIYSFTVNAYYDLSTNAIYIPTGIICHRFYDPDLDPVYNYGAMGAIISHEMMHAFDDQGINYDARGQLKSLLTPLDHDYYQRQINLINDQYTILLEDAHQAELSTSENLTDILGLKVAFRTYRRIYRRDFQALYDRLPSCYQEMDDLKAFFKRWAQCLRSVEDKINTETDDNGNHSPNKIRINAPFSHLIDYYNIYQVVSGDALYIEPAKRAVLFFD